MLNYYISWTINHYSIDNLGFPDSSVGKESTRNAGDPGSIPGLERSTVEGIGYPLQYSWASLVAQLVKNLLAMQETWVQSRGWEDPWRRERLPTPVFWPGEFHGLYSPWGCKELNITERLSLSYFPRFDHWVRKICWRREWLPTPVEFPGEFHGQRSLVGYSPWSHKEPDMTKQLTLSLFHFFSVYLH